MDEKVEGGEYMFPANFSTREKLGKLIRMAIQTPTSVDTQPWRFRVYDDRVEISAGWNGTSNSRDPECRKIATGLGVIAHRMALAMRSYGMKPKIDYAEHSSLVDLSISVAHVGNAKPSLEDRMLVSLIDPKIDRPVSQSIGPDRRNDLTRCAADHNCLIRWIEPGRLRREIAELLRQTRSEVFADKAYPEEIAKWLRRGQNDETVVLHRKSLGFQGLGDSIGPWLVERSDLEGQNLDFEKTICAPLLGVLQAKRDELRDWMDAGQAMSMILLWARNIGLTCEVMETPSIWGRLRSAMETELYPQAILRVGSIKLV